MNKLFLILILFSFSIVMSSQAYAQEPKLATYQESAQVIIDGSISNNVTASITLQSTSNQEILIPTELEEKIRNTERLTAIVITNEEQCIIGVINQSCIMINFEREGLKGIIEIQDTGKNIGNSLIDDLNKLFDTNAKFNSVFVHYDDKSNKALNTTGTISGRGSVSAVYTMPNESTDSMYEKMTALLLAKQIRGSGGFYDIAKDLSKDEKSKMTFSIIRVGNSNLYQIKLSKDYPGIATSLKDIKPLDYLKTQDLKRSNYFSGGFYPLNSIFQTIVLAKEPIVLKNIHGNILETKVNQDVKVPTDLTKAGWVFDPEDGKRIQGKYLFGKETQIKKGDLEFSIAPESGVEISGSEIKFDDSMIIIVIIVVASAGAAVFYLKGYRKS